MINFTMQYDRLEPKAVLDGYMEHLHRALNRKRNEQLESVLTSLMVLHDPDRREQCWVWMSDEITTHVHRDADLIAKNDARVSVEVHAAVAFSSIDPEMIHFPYSSGRLFNMDDVADAIRAFTRTVPDVCPTYALNDLSAPTPLHGSSTPPQTVNRP